MRTDSLERIVPDDLPLHEATGSETYQLHMERYEFAARIAHGRVLDAACGAGYGSYHLASVAKVDSVTGVDLDHGAVDYARSRYAHPAVTFQCSDIMAFSTDVPFDTIVSLETIEHVPDPIGLIHHFCAMLRPGGVFIGSVPVTPSVDANPHHLTDFTASGFKAMLESSGLKVETELLQVQPFSPFRILSGQEKRAQDIRPNLVRYYIDNPSSFVARVVSTLRYGFTNRYLSVHCRKP